LKRGDAEAAQAKTATVTKELDGEKIVNSCIRGLEFSMAYEACICPNALFQDYPTAKQQFALTELASPLEPYC
jgi:hypothetical protein